MDEAAQRWLDRHGVPKRRGSPERSWSVDDAILYALGVGAGFLGDTRDLPFATEGLGGERQRTLPTFATVLAMTPRVMARVDPAAVVHGEQSVSLPAELPAAGTAIVSTSISDVYDKGSGALITERTTIEDRSSGTLLATTTSSIFVRGAGGFGGVRGPAPAWTKPDRSPDHRIDCPTWAGQALLYRLCGDRNPLHADPSFARRAGFSGPILHGLCTYGAVGLGLLRELCDADPARLSAMSGRFAGPVTPGDALEVRAWVDGTEARFEAFASDGRLVLDRGRLSLR